MAAPRKLNFLADAMLASVARKLRIFGFDTLYVAHTRDDEVLRIGIDQSRIILTADKELFKRIIKAGIQGVLVSGAGDFDDLVHILSKCGVNSVDIDGICSRCSICNGPLEERKPDQVKSELPVNIVDLHKEFYQCGVCGKIYWKGGHLKRITALAKKLDDRLGMAIAN